MKLLKTIKEAIKKEPNLVIGITVYILKVVPLLTAVFMPYAANWVIGIGLTIAYSLEFWYKIYKVS